MKFFKFQPDIHGEYGIADYPAVPDGTSFVTGHPVRAQLAQPLVFTVTNPAEQPPGHLLGSMIPVASRRLLDALRMAGVDNLQIFPAALRNTATGMEWPDYAAFNILGLLDGADLSASRYETILDGGELPPRLAFSELVLSHAAVERHRLFRIVQSPLDMFMAEPVRDQLAATRPAEGWGVTTVEVGAHEGTRRR